MKITPNIYPKDILFLLSPTDERYFYTQYIQELYQLFSSYKPLEIKAPTGSTIVLSSDTDQSSSASSSLPDEPLYTPDGRLVAAHIRFQTTDHADRAYARYNQTHFPQPDNSSTFRLDLVHADDIQILSSSSASSSSSSSSSSFARPLYIYNFSPFQSIDWFDLFYNAFQKYGRLIQCHTESTTSLSTVLVVQYAAQQDADKAANEMNGAILMEGYPAISISLTLEDKEPTKEVIESEQHQTSNITRGESKRGIIDLTSSMDLCNLYIKHLDPALTSTELFNLFKPYGRIISARVMEDTDTGQSREFGFVSYSNPVEAAAALLSMDGHDLKTRKKGGPFLSVRFHEPRVHRPERDFQQQLRTLAASTLAPHFTFESKPLAFLYPHYPPAPQPPPAPPSVFWYPSPIQQQQHPQHHHPPIHWTHPYLQHQQPQPHQQQYPPYAVEHSAMSYPPPPLSPLPPSLPPPPNPAHLYYSPPPVFYSASTSPASFAPPQHISTAPPSPAYHLPPPPPSPSSAIQHQQQQQQLPLSSVAFAFQQPSSPLPHKRRSSTRKRASMDTSVLSVDSESVSGSSSEHTFSRQRLLEAVQNILQGEPGGISDLEPAVIVDALIARLTRKECLKCLFNREYLEKQIRLVRKPE